MAVPRRPAKTDCGHLNRNATNVIEVVTEAFNSQDHIVAGASRKLCPRCANRLVNAIRAGKLGDESDT